MLKYLLLGSIVLTQKEIKNLAYQCTERRFVLDFFSCFENGSQNCRSI